MGNSRLRFRAFGLFAAGVLAVTAISGCEKKEEWSQTYGRPPSPGPLGPTVTYGDGPTAGEAPGSYSVRKLLDPDRKYLGAWLPGVPKSVRPVTEWARRAGKKPNILGSQVEFGEPFDRAAVQNAWNAGALPLIALARRDTTLPDIVQGKEDEYLVDYADALRDSRIPVAIMLDQGDDGKAAPKEYVAAYRHLHRAFGHEGVTNVIWVWGLEVDQVDRLGSFWPGNAVVDWVAPLVSSYPAAGKNSYQKIINPVLTGVRRLTNKPVLLARTGISDGPGKPAQITELFRNLETSKSVIGTVWLEDTNWEASNDQASLKAFRTAVSSQTFGFDPRRRK
jgi:hypothetical protein